MGIGSGSVRFRIGITRTIRTVSEVPGRGRARFCLADGPRVTVIVMELSEHEVRLCRAIESRRGALLDDLRLHVGIPTGRGHVPGLEETRERFASRLNALGATVELFEGDPKPAWLLGGEPGGAIPPTAVCRRQRPGSPMPRVLIAGHLDTVHDPAGGFRELAVASDGLTATGPGCVDMKGGLVIALAALEALDEVGIDTSWTFVMNSDEETGSFHSDRVLRAEASGHDVGLALEPALADGSLAIERRGSGQFMIEARGRAAHVGREFDRGVSAVIALAQAILRVAQMPDPLRGLVASIGPLKGGTATNAVPDGAWAWGNVRYPDAESGRELGAMLDALATAPDAMPAIRVERAFNRPAKPLTPATERLAHEARLAAESLGQTLGFASTGGVCDGNNLQAAGLATIDTLGVRGGGLHTSEEWIELASLVQRCQLLALLIARLSAGRGAWA